MPATWQLPPGVSRGLWDYLHDPEVARAYDARLQGTPLLNADLEFVLEQYATQGARGGRFLDLGCGPGRLALALAERGQRVVAVDLSESMLGAALAKARDALARGAAAAIDFVKVNLVELDCFADASFDGAACLFGTLGMVAGANERRRVLAGVERVLRPGGIFVVHVHNLWHHLWTGAGRRLLVGNLGRACMGRQALGDFLMPPHQGIGSLPMHLFTRGEIGRLLRGAGLTIDEVRPISVSGALRAPGWFPRLRAYGYLIAARKASGAA
jgi:SAM-dependent methyltransferase